MNNNKSKIITPEKVDLETYRKFLRERIILKESLPFNNDDSEYAAEVIRIKLEHCSTFLIYDNNLKGTIAKHGIMHDFSKYLLAGKGFHLMLDDTNKYPSDIYHLLSNYIGSNLKIYKAPPKVQQVLKSLKVDVQELGEDIQLEYFSVGDGYMVRSEHNNKEHRAVCDFYDPELGNLYTRFFKHFAKNEIKLSN